jgi:hypothetical protein
MTVLTLKGSLNCKLKSETFRTLTKLFAIDPFIYVLRVRNYLILIKAEGLKLRRKPPVMFL